MHWHITKGWGGSGQCPTQCQAGVTLRLLALATASALHGSSIGNCISTSTQVVASTRVGFLKCLVLACLHTACVHQHINTGGGINVRGVPEVSGVGISYRMCVCSVAPRVAQVPVMSVGTPNTVCPTAVLPIFYSVGVVGSERVCGVAKQHQMPPSFRNTLPLKGCLEGRVGASVR